MVKRVDIGTAVAITDGTTIDYDTPTFIPLLVCQEAVNEETESDGTNVAETTIGSRMVNIKLNLIVNAGGQAGYRWMLIRDQDNDLEANITSLGTGGFFNSANQSPTQAAINRNIIAKGQFRIMGDGLTARIPVFIRKKTLIRCGTLRENDRLKLIIAASNAGTTHNLSGWGNIYVAQT